MAAAPNASQQNWTTVNTPQSPSVSGGWSMPEYNGVQNFALPQATPIAPNQQLLDQTKAQVKSAQDYYNNIPGMVNSQAAGYNQTAKQNLANNIQKTRNSYNDRGLLKSGQRQGAELGEQAATASDMANNRYQLNQQALNNYYGLVQGAATTGANYAGEGPGLGASQLQPQALQNQNDYYNNQNMAGIVNGAGSGIGSLAGAILANRGSGGLMSNMIGNYQLPSYQSPAGGLGLG